MKLTIEMRLGAGYEWENYGEMEVEYKAQVYAKLATKAHETHNAFRVVLPDTTIYAKWQADGGIYIGENERRILS